MKKKIDEGKIEKDEGKEMIINQGKSLGKIQEIERGESEKLLEDENEKVNEWKKWI